MSNPSKSKSKKYLRKRAVAERYSIDERTVDRMARDGRLPAPIYRTRFPIWDEDALDASDRAATLQPRKVAGRNDHAGPAQPTN